MAKPPATPAAQVRTCPACRSGRLQPATRERVFYPHGQTVAVQLLTARCDACGAEVTSAAQHAENLRRLAARKAHYGGLLLGEEIAALRRRYGLTQQQASRLFGKGKIAFSRYESEASYPDDSTTRLLMLAMAKPDVLKWLADLQGETIPLWQQRSQEAWVSVRSALQAAAPAMTRQVLQPAEAGPLPAGDGWQAVPRAARVRLMQTVQQELEAA